MHIGELHGLGDDPTKNSAWIHNLPHSDKLAKHLGKPVKINATLHKVESEHNPETGEKTASVHLHIHGLHGISGLGDALKEKPEHNSKEKELEEAMSDHKV